MPGVVPALIRPLADLTLHRSPPPRPPARPAPSPAPPHWSTMRLKQSLRRTTSLPEARSMPSRGDPRRRTIGTCRHSSVRSRVSASMRRSLRQRGGPLYYSARARMRDVRNWADVVSRRMAGRSSTPLATPARPRLQPTVVVAHGRPSPRPARNSPRVRAARRVAFAAHTLRWEAASGLAALLECGASAGSSAAAAVVRACAAVLAMADARLQQLRRSISSWSLSTVKKPKINIPKLKTPKLKIFSGRKRNRVEGKDDAAAAEAVKAALLSAEGEGDATPGDASVGEAEGRVIHEPLGKESEDQPTIVLTVHDHPSAPDPPPPPPSPGLLDPNDDIEYIDSDEGDTENQAPPRRNGADADYSDQWYDARGTLTRSREDLNRINDDYEECQASTYYDAADGADPPPSQARKVFTPEVKAARGSQKAREWVQSFSEDTERRVRRWMEMQRDKDPSSVPKSKSEIRLDKLDEPSGKWAGRNEIRLNATEDDYLLGEDKDNKSDSQKQGGKTEKNEVARRESLKKIFQVRGKLSIKPIVDSQRPTYTDTDIYIASTPYALANPSGPQDRKLVPGDSLDVSDDGIHCASIDLDPAMELTGDSSKTTARRKLNLEVGTRSDNIPDIIIDSPEVDENRQDLTILGPPHMISGKGMTTVKSDESSTIEQSTEAGEDSTLQDVTWTDDSILTDKNKDTYLDFQLETADSMFEEADTDRNSTLLSEQESPSNCKKPERKKRKIPGSGIHKSIKNFAGSFFNQDSSVEIESDKKKKKGRLSPFSKDPLVKTTSTTADENNSDRKEGGANTGQSDNNTIKSQKNVAKESLPDILPTSETALPGSAKTHKVSTESLEYISPIESDEQKSISSRSSQDIGNPFLDDGELHFRKEALLAIKAQDNDDASTQYYSFLTADDGYQPNSRETETSTPSPQNVVPQIAHMPDSLTSSLTSDPTVTRNVTTTTGHEDNKVTTEGQQSHKPSRYSSFTEKSSKTPKPLNAEEKIAKRQTLTLDTKQETAQQTSQENPQPPKPSPRTKKGRYGYSTGSSTPTTPTGSITKSVTTGPQGTTSTDAGTTKPQDSQTSASSSLGNAVSDEKSFMATFPRRKAPSRQAGAAEVERTSSDSGYAGPGSTYYSGNEEPLYWEISETKGAPPRPSPRAKKGRRAPSEPTLNVATSPKKIEPPVPSQRTNPPDWIQVRAPIPTPRKKQRSLQSLPTVVPDDDSIETVKKKLQLMSSVSLQGSRLPQPPPPKKEEQFYSGKAASISYGFTTGHVAPPSPPVRPRKASQMSLPGAMAAEEGFSKQQKRSSLYGEGSARWGGGSPGSRPPSVRKAQRRSESLKGTRGSTLKPCVQRLGSAVVRLHDLLLAVGLGPGNSSQEKSEELLADVLYSVHSLMGGAGGGVWAVGGPTTVAAAASAGGQTVPASSNRISVSLAQVTQVLQDAFHVSPVTLEELTQQIKTRPVPEVILHLSVKEAKDLRPKTVKGKANPYATVVIPSSGGSQRTRLEKNTLNPKWNQDFSLKVNNIQNDVVRLQIWHEHEAMAVQQLTKIKDMKSLSRLVRETTAQAQHQTNHLLGHVILYLKEVSEGTMDGWFALEKEGGDMQKERGSVRVQAFVSTSTKLADNGRRPYDALLTRLIHHQLTTAANNNKQDEWVTPWNGHVSSGAAAALAQHAIMLGLTEASMQLSWWCVGSRVATVDAAWILSQLHRVQAALGKGLYEGEDLNELQASLSYFVRAHVERLKDLHEAFPPSSGVIAQHQLSYTLKALQSVQTHSQTRALLDHEELPHLQEAVISSLNLHAKNWWTLLVEEQLIGVKTADEQILRVIKILEESHTFLTHAANFYTGIFKKEMDIAYMQTVFIMISKKINPCVRPLVMNIYNRMPALSDNEEPLDTTVQYALDVGTSLWQLYRNLGRIHLLSEALPPEIRAESGVREYHRWFSRGVMRWLELAIRRAQDMIKKAVDLDTFQPVDNLCNFSSSATDTIGIFHDVKIWWLKLAWPDPENSTVLLAKILEDVCSCATNYSDLLRDKVDSMFWQTENSDQLFITERICVGLNNIERVRRELTGLPSHFGFEALLEDVRSIGSGSAAALQLKDTVERLISSATENMEGKVNEFIEAVMEKMKPTLEKAVHEACELQDEAPLLDQVLYPNFKLLHNNLHSLNFQRFLWHVWEVMVEIFKTTVSKNTERRRANYFGGVRNILESTLKFFSPDEGIGLDTENAQTPEYISLLELLDSLRMSTEALIAKYYQERHEQQVQSSLPTKAQLVTKMLFTRPGKLIVEVIMAHDIVIESDTGIISSRMGPHTHQAIDSYVKVQLVPQDWFPAAAIRKTKTQRKDPAVYDETFEFEVNREDDGVRAGLLLFTLKDYNLGRSNTFIGEALVPLSDLPCVDSSEVHTVPNTYLKMTTPGLDNEYKSLSALHYRTWDKNATSFLKKVSKRLADSKTKGATLRPEEERGRPRSPNLIERLKI
ncbi:uncharacterized protein LOC122254194 [Penaeus japonicus]|uniref:uncharacterized protein LOC122254194 n=1 Tax=Penaeus japonicus TaxID=27405 RepID=UPI001C716C00|nr:uncharacterized protein LOC122254194 [Penaeus japonicus]